MPSVRAVYLVPKDKKINPDVPMVISNALIHLQTWYFKKLGIGRTFQLFEPIVETIKTPHSSEWYGKNEHNSDEKFWFFYNVAEDGFDLTGGDYNDEKFVWVYYIDASPKGLQYGGAGTSGVAVLHKDDIEGLLGNDFEAVSRWVGGLGHELGHAFGLDHPPECGNKYSFLLPLISGSLMMYGYRQYPLTHLLAADKEILKESRFFSNDLESEAKFSPQDLLKPKPSLSTKIRNLFRKD